MLEATDPNEPSAGAERAANHGNSNDSSPSDTLPPRRRRAVSRPAGPPAGAPEAAPAIPPVQAPAAPASVEAQAAAPSPVEEPAAEEAAPARTRRRASRKATAPAGTPAPADESAAAVVEPAGQAAPASVEAQAAAPSPVEEPAAEEAAPARTRRRASRKATAPAGTPAPAEESVAAQEPAVTEDEVSETAEADADATDGPTTEPSAAGSAPAAPAAEEAPAEEAAPPRSRRRASRKATAPQSAPQTPDAAEETAASSTEGDAARAEQFTVADALDAPPARSRRRAPRKDRSAPETPAGAEAPEQESKPEGEGAPARSARKKAAETPAPEPEGSGRTRRRAVRPPSAVFQAPVFTEPMFQTPETAAAAAAAEAQARPEPDDETDTAPGARRRRRRREAADETPETTGRTAEEPEEGESAEAGEESGADDESGDRPARRRRRGGRRRRRGETAEGGSERSEDEDRRGGSSDEDDQERAEDDRERAEDESGAEDGGSSSSRRRRRRRRRSGEPGDASGDTGGTDDPERTVVKVREPRKKDEPGTGPDEVQSIKGSTRLEAKKQRRREGREQGRRRVPIITEAEFLARREAVERVMVVRENGDRTQIGVLEDDVLVEHFVNKEQATSYVGNVYLGKVQNVLPSMEAAFVDIGKGRNAVLYAGEVNFEALGMAHGPRRIETALKSGQSVLVQVTKDPIGHKGARLTSQVSLPGRYLVYVPEGSMTGISRKLPDTERARLKTILKKIVPEDAGVIVRTAAEGASEEELRRDVERLQAQWEDIQKKAKSGNAPTLLYGEPDMTVRVVRDIFNEDFSKVIVSGDEAWKTIHDYVEHVAPDLTDRLQKWNSDVDVFATYRIDEQLMKALDRKVWLPSGGSLVIDRTEAMIVVDVNTGKFTGQGGNLEETVTRNNLEAAEEIVRQLRLRDLGGIIVIDFIDMVLESNRDLVLRRLLECLGRDRTKHQVAEVTSLGLVQMTRKRVGQGLLESFSESCVHCNGRGVLVHMEQPTVPGGGGGGKKKKKGKSGGGQPQEHVHEPAPDVSEAPEKPEEETEAEVAAEVAEPRKLPEPEFTPDEDLFGSAAEAEAAASRGRSRRRAGRKVSAPAGSPKASDEAAVIVAPAKPAPEEAARPEPAAAEPQAAPEPAVESAAPVRTRRRVTRKVSSPAGPPQTQEAVAAEIVVPAATAGEPAGTSVEEPGAVEDDGSAPEGTTARKAPARKSAAKKTATKTAAKKTAVKKTAAKKTAAKKTTAKKAAKKTVAAEQSAAVAPASADEA